MTNTSPATATPAYRMNLDTRVGIVKWAADRDEHYLRMYGRGELTYDQYVVKCANVANLADIRLRRLDRIEGK